MRQKDLPRTFSAGVRHHVPSSTSGSAVPAVTTSAQVAMGGCYGASRSSRQPPPASRSQWRRSCSRLTRPSHSSTASGTSR